MQAIATVIEPKMRIDNNMTSLDGILMMQALLLLSQKLK